MINLLPGITGAILKVHRRSGNREPAELQIAAHIRLSLHHPGNVAVRPPAPRTRVWQAQSLCMNRQSTNQFFPIDEESSRANLVRASRSRAASPSCRSGTEEARGFRCSNVNADIVRQLVPAISAAIKSWYFCTPNQRTLCAPGRGQRDDPVVPVARGGIPSRGFRDRRSLRHD